MCMSTTLPTLASVTETLSAWSAAIAAAVPLLALVGTSVVAYWFNRSLAPVLRLQVEPRWVGADKVILRLVVENVSRRLVKGIKFRFQVIPRELARYERIPEWVPLTVEDAEDDPVKSSLPEPVQVFKSTLTVYPGERITGESMETCPEGHILHVLLQAYTGERRTLGQWFWSWGNSWTITQIVERQGQR